MWATFGHNNAKNILEKQIQNNLLANAYLFEGVSGIGKFTLAKEFAGKVVKSGNETSPDILHLDIATIEGVVEFRDFLARISFAPVASTNLVAIIDNIHLASKAMSNSLLKTLEEPNGQAIIVLVSATKQLLPTIVSRAQVIHFNEFSKTELSEYTKNNLQTDEASLQKILKVCGGSIASLIELSKNHDKLENLLKQVEELDLCLARHGNYERVAMVQKLADLDDSDLGNLFTAWMNISKSNLRANPKLTSAIRLAYEATLKLKQNLNKKMVLQHFLLNAKYE